MKDWLGKIMLAGCIVVGGWLTLWSQSPANPTATNRDLNVISTQLPGGVQQLVVVDSANRTFAVYHIEPSQGKVQLRSVRNLTWDLQMEQFNGQSPLPSEVRQFRP